MPPCLSRISFGISCRISCRHNRYYPWISCKVHFWYRKEAQVSNSFPAVPAGFQLSQVSYQAVLPHPEAQPGGPVDFGAGVTAHLTYSVPVLGLVFSFTEPGSFGAFDQAAVEGALASSITGVCEVLAGMSGVALAAIQAGVSVTRSWEWANGSVAFTTQDTVTYP